MILVRYPLLDISTLCNQSLTVAPPTVGTGAEFDVWTSIEPSVAVISACLPTFRPLFNFNLRQSFGNFRKSSEKTDSRDSGSTTRSPSSWKLGRSEVFEPLQPDYQLSGVEPKLRQDNVAQPALPSKTWSNNHQLKEGISDIPEDSIGITREFNINRG